MTAFVSADTTSAPPCLQRTCSELYPQILQKLTVPRRGSEVAVGQAGIAQDAPSRVGLQVLVPVDRPDGPPPGGDVAIDGVTAGDSRQRPAALFEDAAHLLAGDDL